MQLNDLRICYWNAFFAMTYEFRKFDILAKKIYEVKKKLRRKKKLRSALLKRAPGVYGRTVGKIIPMLGLVYHANLNGIGPRIDEVGRASWTLMDFDVISLQDTRTRDDAAAARLFGRTWPGFRGI